MTATNRPSGLRTALAFAAILFAGLPAAAATCNPSNVTTDIGIAALDCAANIPGGPGGNVGEDEMNGNAVFGKTGWLDFGKIDLPGTVGGFLEIAFDSERKTGSWKLADGFSFDANGHYALVLKAGAPGNDNGSSARGKKQQAESVFNIAYLLDTTSDSGTWSTADLLNNGGQQPGLSNMTLFGTVAPVPLPAAAWLLIGGIAGLGAVARKRKAATA